MTVHLRAICWEIAQRFWVILFPFAKRSWALSSKPVFYPKLVPMFWWRANKTRFLDFFKVVLVFKNCGIILHLYSTWKIDVWPLKSKFSVKIFPLRGLLWLFSGSKASFSGLLSLLWSYSGVAWVFFPPWEGQLLVVFSVRKVEIWRQKSEL